MSISEMLRGIYRFFFPEWVQTTARVVDPICDLTGSGDYRKPYVCYCALEYNVEGVVYTAYETISHHQELVDGDEVAIKYVRHDPRRILLL